MVNPLKDSVLKKLFSYVVDAFQGRATAFAMFFAVSGFVLEYLHRLDMNYVYLIGALQGWVVVHSAQENYFNVNPPAPPQQGGQGGTPTS